MTNELSTWKITITTLTLLSSGGGVYGIYWIIKENKSRLQIREILLKSKILNIVLEKLDFLLKKLRNITGGSYTIKSYDICLAITFLYSVISLAASEIYGSKILIGNTPLLEKQILPPGSIVFLLVFLVLLTFKIIMSWNRQLFINSIFNLFHFKRMINAKTIYWIFEILVWSFIGLMVWIVASESLFMSCLIIGIIALFGSFNTITRIISLVIAFILPFVIIYFKPDSSVALFLVLLYIVITPLKSFWDWLSMGFSYMSLRKVLLNTSNNLWIIIRIIKSILLAFLSIIGVIFSIAFIFLLLNKVIYILGGLPLDWSVFYEYGFNSPLKKGLFFSIICLITVLPIFVSSFILVIIVLLKPFPGKKQVELLCIKPSPTALELTWIILYVISSIILRIVFLVLYSYTMVLIVTKLLIPLFLGSLDLATQLF